MNEDNEIEATNDTNAAPRRKPSAPKATGAQPMTMDDRFGPRPADVTHWRCFRIEEGRKGAPLFWGDDEGLQVSEWPIATLAIESIRERWGAGRYVVHYMRIDADNQRTPRGRSRVLQLVGGDDTGPEVVIAARRAPAPVAAPAHPLATIGGNDPSYVFSLLTFLEDRNDKARAAARADMEMLMERERLASQERIAQIQAAAGGGTNLHAVILERLAKIEGRLEGQGEGGDDSDDGSPMVAVPAGSIDWNEMLKMAMPWLLQNAGPLLANLTPNGPGAAGAPAKTEVAA